MQARIYLDGRSHPKDLKRTSMGHDRPLGRRHTRHRLGRIARGELITAEESIAVWLSAVDASAS